MVPFNICTGRPNNWKIIDWIVNNADYDQTDHVNSNLKRNLQGTAAKDNFVITLFMIMYSSHNFFLPISHHKKVTKVKNLFVNTLTLEWEKKSKTFHFTNGEIISKAQYSVHISIKQRFQKAHKLVWKYLQHCYKTSGEKHYWMGNVWTKQDKNVV